MTRAPAVEALAEETGTGPEPSPKAIRAELGLRWPLEVLVIAIFYGTYSWIRNQFGSGGAPSVDTARRNAQRVIDWEESLGLLVEEKVQDMFVDWTWFIQFWNLFYGLFHFLITGFTLLYLFYVRPRSYAFWRTAGLATTGVALAGYALFPLMPPRLLGNCGSFGACEPSPFVDTVIDVGGIWSFESGGMAALSNQFAAMPSMHFGWATWCALVLVTKLRRPVARVAAGLYPLLTLFAIVVTANHWILDAVGGLLAVGVGVILAFGVGQIGRADPARP